MVKTALEETVLGKGLQGVTVFPAGETKWRPPDFLKHQQTSPQQHHIITKERKQNCVLVSVLYHYETGKRLVNGLTVTLSLDVKAVSHRCLVIFVVPRLYFSEMCKLCIQPPSLKCQGQQEK
jgi:hypothetical protein